MNGYIAETDSAKPSVMIQPVMAVPGEPMNDRYSEYSAHSTGKRSKRDFKLWVQNWSSELSEVYELSTISKYNEEFCEVYELSARSNEEFT